MAIFAVSFIASESPSVALSERQMRSSLRWIMSSSVGRSAKIASTRNRPLSLGWSASLMALTAFCTSALMFSWAISSRAARLAACFVPHERHLS